MAPGMASLIEVGDYLHIHYGVAAVTAQPGAAADKGPTPRSIMLAARKRDRLVSIGATDDGGYILTRPLSYPGGRLDIDARVTRRDGFVRVAAREQTACAPGNGWPAWVSTLRSRCAATAWMRS